MSPRSLPAADGGLPLAGPPSILLVTNDQGLEAKLAPALTGAGYEVLAASSLPEGLQMLEAGTFDVVLSDSRLPQGSGGDFLDCARRLRPLQVVVVLIPRGSPQQGIQAMKRGAFNFVAQPGTDEELLVMVQRASERARLLGENTLLHSQIDRLYSLDNIVGRHGTMEEVLRLICKVAPTSTTVMIYGESGTGKELVARAIHQLSPRSNRPMYAVNCSAIPDALLESELFGFEKGAFTGAYTRKRGLLEQASGSTLFLDEVGDLNPPLQGKLLRVLQERVIQRLGGSETIPVDLRVLSATHRDLGQMVAAGTFRQDLYYRLNTFPITISPLHERATDIPLLVEHFLEKVSRREGMARPRISRTALARLVSYPWPGNVRQLEAAIERASILAEGGVIEDQDLPQEVLQHPAERSPTGAIDIPDEGLDLAELERHLLRRAMEKSGWVITRAARLLGLTFRTMQYRLGKHGIARPDQGS